MSDFASRPDAALDQWLAAQHRHMVTDLAATLDLEAGLREAMIPARHANLVADLGGVLDVETALSAIVPPTTPDPTPHKPETTGISYSADVELVAAMGRFGTDPQQAWPGPMLLTDLESLVRVAASRSPGTRLAMRTHPAFGLAHDLGHVLDSTHVLDSARNLAIDRGLARALVRVIDRDCDRDCDHAHVLNLNLARAHTRDLVQMTRVVADLHHALSDFTGVDLRSVDLAGIPLDGLRWSTETKWPPQWAEQVWRDSVEVADGIFEVRGGNRYAPTTV